MLTEVLGAGGFGAVYLAKHPRLERNVALKVLHPGYAADPKVRLAFDREAKLIARLDHPNIVAVYDHNDEHLWLSMRHVPGGDLAKLINAEPKGLNPQRVARLITDAARALDYAHRSGVLHRDVKPANILAEQHPDGERAILTDFGIARALDATVTATGIAATLAYTAPERFTRQAVDHRADVYSLGCTLFHLLTGYTPFQTTDLAAAIAAHLSQIPPSPRDVRSELPRYLDSVLATALAKDPRQRYSTCSELAENVTRAVTATTYVPVVPPPHESEEVRLRRAADRDDNVAMYNLGVLLHNPGRLTDAETWYRKAAATGHSDAMVYLANLLEKRGKPTDAETWYRKAAATGHTDAMVYLANLLKKRGKPTDAETWYRKAADNGDTAAMNDLANLLRNRGEHREAETWYQRAAHCLTRHRPAGQPRVCGCRYPPSPAGFGDPEDPVGALAPRLRIRVVGYSCAPPRPRTIIEMTLPAEDSTAHQVDEMSKPALS